MVDVVREKLAFINPVTEEGNQDHELLLGFWCTTYNSAYNL